MKGHRSVWPGASACVQNRHVVIRLNKSLSLSVCALASLLTTGPCVRIGSLQVPRTRYELGEGSLLSAPKFSLCPPHELEQRI